MTKVLLKESVPSLVTGAAIALTTILGYSAMAGAVGGGGLGDLAIKYGYHRYQTDVLLLTLIILVLLVQVIQALGNAVAKRIDHRK